MVAEVYVQCLELPADAVGRCAESPEASFCFALHRVQWRRTLISTDAQGALCLFRAPDAESVRLALRHMHVAVASIWVDDKA
jgi:hypothetical protein